VLKTVLVFALLLAMAGGQTEFEFKATRVWRGSALFSPDCTPDGATVKVDFGSGPEIAARCEKGKWVRAYTDCIASSMTQPYRSQPFPVQMQIQLADGAWQNVNERFRSISDADVPALKKSETFCKQQSTNIGCDAFMTKEDFYCADPNRSLQISQNELKAWCHRGPD